MDVNPSETEGAAKPSAGAGTSYKDPRKLCKALLIILVVGLVSDAVGLLASVGQLSLVQGIAAGEFFTDAEIDRSDNFVIATEVIQLATALVTAVVWVIWFRRLYRNLTPLGARALRFKPGWAVGAWFVPLLSLVRPKAIMDDIWRASDPELPDTAGTVWHEAPVPWFLHVWWGLFLLSLVLHRVSAALLDSTELDDILDSARFSVAEDFAWVMAGLVALKVVASATARQRERAQRLASPSGSAPSDEVRTDRSGTN